MKSQNFELSDIWISINIDRKYPKYIPKWKYTKIPYPTLLHSNTYFSDTFRTLKLPKSDTSQLRYIIPSLSKLVSKYIFYDEQTALFCRLFDSGKEM